MAEDLKQIIIDGTKCKYAHFDGGNTQRLLCAIDDCFCDCYRENECYYKQLKRKEQECERLKEHHYELEEKFLELNVKAYSNSLELDQLKGDREEALKQLEFVRTLNTVQEAEIRKLSKTLTEIKEIAEECYYKCNSMNNCNISCKYYNDCNGEFSYLLAYLNKQISECEVNDVY